MMPRPDYDYDNLTSAVLCEALNALRIVDYAAFESAASDMTEGARLEAWGAFQVDPARFLMANWGDRRWHARFDQLLAHGLEKTAPKSSEKRT